MMDRYPGKNIRASQTQRFGQRLEWARKRSGFPTRKAAIEGLPEKAGIAPRTYYAHERGERLPEQDATMAIYCTVFGVSRDFLMFGTGPEMKEFERAQSIDNQSVINQPSKEVARLPSQADALRYIPIIRASEIKQILTGEGTLADMSEELLPLPRQMLAGPRSFAYEIPDDDHSMVGRGAQSFPPGAHVVIDPDQEIKPTRFVMVWLKGWAEPVIRQLQSQRPIIADAPQFPFKLIALNERFEAIECSNADECRILGRVVFTLNAV
jgi:SOS-response transcriptional repressor LexA